MPAVGFTAVAAAVVGPDRFDTWAIGRLREAEAGVRGAVFGGGEVVPV